MNNGVPPLELGPAIPVWSWDAIVTQFFSYLIAFAAAAVFAGIVYSGYMMIVSSGDAGKFAAAKKNLLWSLAGLLVVVLAYFLVSFAYGVARDVS